MRMPSPAFFVVGDFQHGDGAFYFALPAHRPAKRVPRLIERDDPRLQVPAASLRQHHVAQSRLTYDESLGTPSQNTRSMVGTVGTHPARAGISGFRPSVVLIA